MATVQRLEMLSIWDWDSPWSLWNISLGLLPLLLFLLLLLPLLLHCLDFSSFSSAFSSTALLLLRLGFLLWSLSKFIPLGVCNACSTLVPWVWCNVSFHVSCGRQTQSWCMPRWCLLLCVSMTQILGSPAPNRLTACVFSLSSHGDFVMCSPHVHICNVCHWELNQQEERPALPQQPNVYLEPKWLRYRDLRCSVSQIEIPSCHCQIYVWVLFLCSFFFFLFSSSLSLFLFLFFCLFFYLFF